MNQPDTWEKEFDKYFRGFKYDECMWPIKHFIRTLRKDWLRSEIEKLENVIRDFIARWEHPDSGLPLEHTVKSETIYHLTSIITRYKEELKVLESK